MEKRVFNLEVAIRQCQSEYSGYATKTIDGLGFHKVGHNASHDFWVAKFHNGFLVYSYSADCDGICDEDVRFKSPEGMTGAYLGHW